jgi:hypothetical protein
MAALSTETLAKSLACDGSTGHVFIRRDLLTLAARDPRAMPRVAPGVADSVDALRDYGWHVVVLEPGQSDGGRAPRERTDGQDRRGWLLTNDIADDRWARPLGLRTALVGPPVESGLRPERCDVAFRDLRTAVLEILAGDVAGPEPPAAI